jgi:hypothetical protein
VRCQHCSRNYGCNKAVKTIKAKATDANEADDAKDEAKATDADEANKADKADLPDKAIDTTEADKAEATVGTLKDGYVCNVPLLRAPRIQHANSVTTPEHDTCYSIQVPRIPTWSDITRSLTGLGRRTLLPFSHSLV